MNLEQEVLFQKLGNAWYIFTEISGDMVYSVLPKGLDPQSTNLELIHVIEEHLEKVANQKKTQEKEAAA